MNFVAWNVEGDKVQAVEFKLQMLLSNCYLNFAWRQLHDTPLSNVHKWMYRKLTAPIEAFTGQWNKRYVCETCRLLTATVEELNWVLPVVHNTGSAYLKSWRLYHSNLPPPVNVTINAVCWLATVILFIGLHRSCSWTHGFQHGLSSTGK